MKFDFLRSLKHRNYRLFFIGQGISVTGTWLQMTAMPWLVYRLTGSAFLLGLIGFLSQISILLFSPLAGAVADHYNRKNLLILTQTLAMLQALVLAVLTLTGHIQIWHIIVLSIFLGIVNAFDAPVRQSFLVEMVGKEDLMNGIALNSSLFNGARLIGPAVAGILIAAVGEGYCFLLNAVSYIAVIIMLFFITRQVLPPPFEDTSILEKMTSGIAYLRKAPQLSAILLLIAITGMVGVFPMILMPVFVKDIYHMGAAGLGIFMSAMGVGALAGTLRIASMQSYEKAGKLIIRASAYFGIFIILFSLSKNMYLSIALLVPIGYSMVHQMALSNTLLQVSVPDEIRGRIMGFYTMAFLGLAPVGSLIAGSLAHKISAPLTVGIGGIACLAATLFFREKIHANE